MIKDHIKSMLFVPGHKTNFLNKLDPTISDVVVLDLEDAVPSKQKSISKKKFRKNKNFF